MALHVKRVYEAPSQTDGQRILVDRLWPRGLSKEKAKIHYWMREIAPSTELRRWYDHDHQKWSEFRSRYFAELAGQPEALDKLLRIVGEGTVTLVFGSKEEQFNNAFALKEFLESTR